MSVFPVTIRTNLTGSHRLHQPTCRLRSVAVIKRFAIPVVLLLAIMSFMSACVSRDEDVSDRSSSQAAPVPGEKIPDEGAYAPGPPGSSGSVRW